MGRSVTASICFGVVFEEGQYWPWSPEEMDDMDYEDAPDWYGDVEEWWRHTNNYEELSGIYNEWDTYPNVSEADKEKYWAHHRQWLENNPLPVEEVNYCHGDYPMYILAIPRTVTTAYQGNPKRVPQDVLELSETEIQNFLDFFDQHGLQYEESQIGWWLSGYYG